MDDEHGDAARSGNSRDRGTDGYHVPVLSKAVIDGLITDPTGVYVDATLGGGGHTEALLQSLEADALVVGIDQDEEAVAAALERLQPYSDRLLVIQGNFSDMRQLLAPHGVSEVDGLLLDLGVSSHQIDSSERGFSYATEGPLDMRMSRSGGVTAAEIINQWSEAELRQLLYDFGEERRAPRIARAIVQQRPLKTTRDLAAVVKAQAPYRERVKTLSRVFQAIRIAVNSELEALEQALVQGLQMLRIGRRMAVISYHSLEDRRVKYFFRYGNFAGKPVKDFYGNLVTPWHPVTRKPLTPADAEIRANPRARSARLRIAEKIELPRPDG